MTEEALSSEQAQQQIAAIKGNPDHPYHRGDQQAVGEVYRLTQIELGDRGREVLFQMGMPSPSTAAAMGTLPSAGADPSESAPAEAPVTTPETALGLADDVGFDTGEMSKLIALEARYPSGRFSREQALHNLGPVERGELERLHTLGFSRLPLSLQIHLERRGTAFAPGLFSRIAELGGELEAFDEQIAVEAARDPGSARLRELVARRHGRRHVTVF